MEDTEIPENIHILMKERTTKAITQLFQANLVAIILYIVKFRRPVFVATPNNSLATTPTWKLSAKFFTYVPTIKLTIFFALMERSSINNSLSVYGGISSTAALRKACII